MSLTGGRYTIDSAASTVNWKGTEITGKSHVGTVDIYKGNLEVVDETIAKAFVSMDMNTIVVTDEGMGDGAKERLLDHLKSEDFFGVEKFPDSQMFIEGIKEKDGCPMSMAKSSSALFPSRFTSQLPSARKMAPSPWMLPSPLTAPSTM